MADTAASAFSAIGTWVAMASGDKIPFIDVSGTGAAKNSYATVTEFVAEMKLNGLAGTGANTFTAAQVIDGSADAIQLRIKGHSTQTASLVVIENDGGTDLITIDPTVGQIDMGYGGIAARNVRIGYSDASTLAIPADAWRITLGAGNDIDMYRAAADTLAIRSQFGGGAVLRLIGDQLTGAEYLTLTHNGTNGVISCTEGLKIGTATSQTIGFWNVTPVVQPAGVAQAAPAGYATGAFGLDSDVNMQAFYDLVVAMRTALVDCGIMKGAA